jgi:DNA-binding response OmpR family regulator
MCTPHLPDQSALQRILAVDDDPFILRLVATKLENSGYHVLKATSAGEALQIVEQSGLPHLGLFDIDMPEMNGFELCQRLQSFSDLPVILLTALDQEETIIEGIERYAEDYIVKPFRAGELVARVRRVLRRMGDFQYTLSPVIQVDDILSVDFVRQQIWINGNSAALTPTETKILYILMRNAGRTVTTDFFLRRIWPREEIYEDTLRVHIHRLRQKLEPTSSQRRYISTQRGLGYAFLVKIKPDRFPHARK